MRGHRGEKRVGNSAFPSAKFGGRLCNAFTIAACSSRAFSALPAGNRNNNGNFNNAGNNANFWSASENNSNNANNWNLNYNNEDFNNNWNNKNNGYSVRCLKDSDEFV
ncbi:FISUMP domain-containing protein [uncultured Fibrobacter sp.]|uniref:FISUMP domain-containing protein n=1 Tax=uncultured Fibrobacter sp. TaxID=261512 RepID=UPI002803E046|nr:FISUMP domain-containing protein [uncultured Fibrobacter sp.]